MAFWSSFTFQNLYSVVNSHLESLHDLVMVWLLIVMLVVMVSSYLILYCQSVVFLSLESKVLEITWTVIPVLILVTIGLPSIYLLSSQDTSLVKPGLTLKLISNQWNWQSEFSDQSDHLLDSLKLDELSNYENPLVVPKMKDIRLLLTSSDVLHSLGLPNMGIKLDSAPGRLNASILTAYKSGLSLGSCYELCGSGHSAMPVFVLII